MKQLGASLAFLLVIIGLSIGNPTGSNDHTVADHDKVVACYWGTWSFYRARDSFDIPNIDTTLCTHIFYGFAELHPDTHKIYAWDPWYDLDATDGDLNATCNEGNCKYNSYRRFNALKGDNPNFKTLLSIGGWNAGSHDYSEMAKDPSIRKVFVDSLVPFLKRFGFDGLDLDWEYPGARDGDPLVDKEDFTVLVKEMAEALHGENLLFTAAVSASWNISDYGYDIPAIMPHFDFVNIMSYDFHGLWGDDHLFTGHNAPLAPRKEENDPNHPGYRFNVYDAAMYWLDQGAPANKLVLGIPFYGRGFILTNWEEPNVQDGLYCPSHDALPYGYYTNLTGYWGYHDILFYFDDSSMLIDAKTGPDAWKIVRDECYKSPYAVNNKYWVGYDDVESVTYKVQLVNHLDLKGAMIWSIDTDDFKASFSSTKFPLLKAINTALAKGDKYNPEDTLGSCGTAPICDLNLPSTPQPSTPKPTTPEPSTPKPTTPEPSTPKPTNPPGPGSCSEHGQKLPFPGDCHKYLMCIQKPDGTFETKVFNCGDQVFDPNIGSCVDPNLPGNEDLCDE